MEDQAEVEVRSWPLRDWRAERLESLRLIAPRLTIEEDQRPILELGGC